MAMWLTARTRKYSGVLLALPSVLWLVTFFLLPLVIVFVFSFMTRDTGVTGVSLPFTFSSYERAFDVFDVILIRSVRIALYTTLICLVIGYPIAFYIRTRKTVLGRNIALFLIILPFWTNFLVRTYAWQVLLSENGTINGFLRGIGLLAEGDSLQMLQTEGAVLLGLVYGYLPFMVLPIYASLRRFDFRLVEAANDLGARDLQVFWRVIVPMTLPGIIAGSILVFIPAIGSFVTPDMLGGTKTLMIGTLIGDKFERDRPLGAALSMIMMAMVLVALVIYAWSMRKESRNNG